MLESPFRITEIKSNSNQQISEPLDALTRIGILPYEVTDDTLGQSKYDFTYRTFPNDLGNEYNGHYMIININVPTTSKGDARGAYSAFYNIDRNEFSKVDVLRFGRGAGSTNLPGAQSEMFVVPRFTRRITESIALYMPTSGIIYNSQPLYEDISLSALGGGVIGSFMSGVVERIAPSLSGGLSGPTGDLIGKVPQIAGYPINPRVEILYSTTPQKAFVFEVLMAPRNENESKAVKEIVQTLRFHSAPEIDPTLGLTFIPPAEFDITFYNKGKENLHIPRINTCVLERIEVDYSPTGVYSTFKNGHPVAVRLSLGFREIEITHKRRVLQGF